MQELRELVAGIILSDPDKFSTVMLGRSNEDYAEWIMKGQSWGGRYMCLVHLVCLVRYTCLTKKCLSSCQNTMAVSFSNHVL